MSSSKGKRVEVDIDVLKSHWLNVVIWQTSCAIIGVGYKYFKTRISSKLDGLIKDKSGGLEF